MAAVRKESFRAFWVGCMGQCRCFSDDEPTRDQGNEGSEMD